MSLTTIFSLTDDVWREISAEINDQDIRFGLMLSSKQFMDLFTRLKITRDKWRGVDYKEIAYSQTIHLPASINTYRPVCMGFPLHNGDIAFGLTADYDYYSKGFPYDNSIGRPSRLAKDWQDGRQAILVFNSGSNTPIQLIGHQYGIRQVLQHNASTLISIGIDNTLRIWDKLTGVSKHVIRNFTEESGYFTLLNLRNEFNKKLNRSPKGYIEDPIFLLSLNNYEIACFNTKGTAFVWNVETGQSVRELIRFNSQRLNNDGFTQKNGHLIILHEDSKNKDHFSWQLKKYTIFDIKKEKIIKTIKIDKIKSHLLKYLETLYVTYPYLSEKDKKEILNIETSESMHCIDYSHKIAVLVRYIVSIYDHHKTTYFYDVENEKIIFGFVGCDVQYKFLENGTLVILYHTTEGWHVLSDYCHEICDFKIKHSQLEDRNQQYENFRDRVWLILNNGNIVTYSWKIGFSSLWYRLTQNFSHEFELKDPPISFSMLKNCSDNLALHCLPDGKILAYSNDGIFAIWDEKRGGLLLNKKLTGNNISNDSFRCFNIYQNGDLYFTWRVNPSPENESLTPDTYDSKLLRFNFFQNPSIKKNSNQDKEKLSLFEDEEYEEAFGHTYG